MKPVDRAAQVHGAISLFRGSDGEVQRYAKSLSNEHVLELPSLESQHSSPHQNSSIEVTSPAELSDRILSALFGQWPPKPGR